MRKMPLGIQNFREIVEGDYVYVDKTRYVYNLTNDAKHYFLSRPRRFGKSLLLDTIAEAFGGDRELFKGLYIYDTDFSFEKHPVLRLDMSNIANETPDVLKDSLAASLRKRVEDEGLDIPGNAPSTIFQFLIEALSKKYGKGVVILIDEYDKPILDHMDELDVAEANRKVLRGFYGVLKSMDPHIRLTFITGVTKFTKTSIFSELNNLYDITLTKKYSNICGITNEDLANYFQWHIDNLATLDHFKRFGSIHDKILEWYDGYSWDGKTRVINPFSLLTFFMQGRFSSFWYSSGTPKFLIDLIKKMPGGYVGLENLEIGEWSLDTFDIRNMTPGSLLFQTGYLTVKEVLPDTLPAVYLLGMPNHEVRLAFNLHVLSEFTEGGAEFAESAHRKIKGSLKTGDLQGMLDILRSLFASIPYQLHISREAYYHSIFLALMNVLGFETYAEVPTATGRIDAVLELDDKVYIMEFKYKDAPPDAAPEEKEKLSSAALEEGLAQIKAKGYHNKYKSSGKKIYHAAFAFLGRDEIEMKIG